MTRGKNEHLDELELAALRKDLRAGLNTSFLATKYNISTRVVAVRRAEMFGRATARTKVKAVPKTEPKPKPMPPPNCIPSVAHKIMAGRA